MLAYQPFRSAVYVHSTIIIILLCLISYNIALQNPGYRPHTHVHVSSLSLVPSITCDIVYIVLTLKH